MPTIPTLPPTLFAISSREAQQRRERREARIYRVVVHPTSFRADPKRRRRARTPRASQLFSLDRSAPVALRRVRSRDGLHVLALSGAADLLQVAKDVGALFSARAKEFHQR